METMKDMYGRPVRIVNSHPAPTAAQVAIAMEAEAQSARWDAQTGTCDQSMGGTYELSQIIAMLNEKARIARSAGYKLVLAIVDTRTGELVNGGKAVSTKYGSKYPNARNGKTEWVDITWSDKTLAKRGYELVGAWVKA